MNCIYDFLATETCSLCIKFIRYLFIPQLTNGQWNTIHLMTIVTFLIVLVVPANEKLKDAEMLKKSW